MPHWQVNSVDVTSGRVVAVQAQCAAYWTVGRRHFGAAADAHGVAAGGWFGATDSNVGSVCLPICGTNGGSIADDDPRYWLGTFHFTARVGPVVRSSVQARVVGSRIPTP